MSRIVTKEDLRAILLKKGIYDLTKEEDRLRLRKRINGTWRWQNSGLRDLIPELKDMGPKKILTEKVSFKNRQMPAYNAKQILDHMRHFRNVLFFGTGALTAAVAFGIQWCHEKPAKAHHRTIAEINTDPNYDGIRTMGTARGDLLVLELYPDAPGKMWASEQKRLVAALKSHIGPIILVYRGDRQVPSGQLCQVVVDYLKPADRYPIGLK